MKGVLTGSAKLVTLLTYPDAHWVLDSNNVASPPTDCPLNHGEGGVKGAPLVVWPMPP